MKIFYWQIKIMHQRIEQVKFLMMHTDTRLFT